MLRHQNYLFTFNICVVYYARVKLIIINRFLRWLPFSLIMISRRVVVVLSSLLSYQEFFFGKSKTVCVKKYFKNKTNSPWYWIITERSLIWNWKDYWNVIIRRWSFFREQWWTPSTWKESRYLTHPTNQQNNKKKQNKNTHIGI